MRKLVINSIATCPGGGLTNLLGLLEGWKDNDVDLDITVIISHPDTISALTDAPGIYSILEVPRMSLYHRLRWERSRLPKLLKNLKADALLSNNFASPGVSCPQIVHHQNLFLWTNWLPRRTIRLSIQRWLSMKTVGEAASNVFISDFLRATALERMPTLAETSVVIHYGLSGLFGENHRTRKNLNFPSHRLCAIQSSSVFKDNDSLLRAFASLVSAKPDLPWGLEIAGYGDWNPWKRLASSLGILDRITWLGTVDSVEIANMLGRSDCLIYPSVMEAFGIPILEGMASGCPVIAVDSGPAREISGGAFLPIPPQSPDEIVQAVRLLYDEQVIREEIIESGLKRAREFSWKLAASLFYDVIENTVSADK